MDIVAILTVGGLIALMALNGYLHHLRRCPYCGHNNAHYPWEYRLCQGCKRPRP